MKLSNFSLDKRIGDSFSNYVFYAAIDVTTCILFCKKTERKEICRKYGDSWFFVDTGKYTPDFQAEELARAWTAQTGQLS
jgi:hypothetical protein